MDGECFSYHSIQKTLNSIKPFLKDIDTKDKRLVFGYIRDYAYNTNAIYIPLSIVQYIVIYAFCVIEKWDTNTNFSSIKLTNDDTIINKKETYVWENVFGFKPVSMNTGTHQWTIKLIAGPGTSRWVLFGLVPQHKVDALDTKQNNKQSLKWIINPYLSGYAVHLGNGYFFENGYNEDDDSDVDWEGGQQYLHQLNYINDREAVVSMIFDTNNRTLRYVFNDRQMHNAMEDIKEQNYKMGVSALCQCTIHFVSYTHTPYNIPYY
eukprot:589871_1